MVREGLPPRKQEEENETSPDYIDAIGNALRSGSSSIPSYSGGITLPKYESQEVIKDAPSDRASVLLNEIRNTWKKSRMNEKGERVILSKKDKKETFWGDWIAEKMSRTIAWQDKERAYVRTNLPTIADASADPVVMPKDIAPLQEIRPTKPEVMRETEAERLHKRLLTIEIELLKRRIAES